MKDSKIIYALVVGLVTILATGSGWWIRDRLTNAERTALQAVDAANIAVGVGRDIEKEISKLGIIMEGVRDDLKDIKENAKGLAALNLRVTRLEVRFSEKHKDHK